MNYMYMYMGGALYAMQLYMYMYIDWYLWQEANRGSLSIMLIAEGCVWVV